jgi:hypothetical protein
MFISTRGPNLKAEQDKPKKDVTYLSSKNKEKRTVMPTPGHKERFERLLGAAGER